MKKSNLLFATSGTFDGVKVEQIPLKLAKVPKARIHEILKLAEQYEVPFVQDVRDAVELLTNPVLYEKALQGIPQRFDKSLVTQITQSDYDTYLSSGSMEHLPHGEMPKAFVRLGVVIEPKNNDYVRRPVHWTEHLNTLMRDLPPKAQPTNLSDLLSNVHYASFAQCYDLEKSYYQWPLDPSVRNFHVVAVQVTGKKVEFLRLTVAPTGFTKTPAVGDTFLRTLKYIAEIGTQREGSDTDHYIDNGRFLDGHGAAGFLSLCDEVQVTLNDEPHVNLPHTRGPFCGPIFDYERKTVCLKDTTVQKLSMYRDTLDSWTFDDMAAAMSLLYYAAQVLRAPTDSYYYAIKWYRRRSAALSKDPSLSRAQAYVWRSARPSLEAWLDYVITNSPVVPAKHPTQEADWHLFTDAASYGWGVVLVNSNGIIWTLSGVFNNPDVHINGKEILALREGLHLLTELDPVPASVAIRVDNTTALHAFTKGRSRSFLINQLVQITAHILPLSTAAHVSYIESSLNPADPLTRHPTSHLSARENVWAQLPSAYGRWTHARPDTGGIADLPVPGSAYHDPDASVWNG